MSTTMSEPQQRSPNLDHIRLADQADEEQIFYLVRLAHEEGAFHKLDPDKVAAQIRGATNGDKGIIGVIGPRHDLRAAIFLTFETWWYSNELMLQEHMCFVRPDSRNSYYSRDLIAYAKHAADELKVDLLIGVQHSVRSEGKCRLYRRWLPKIGEYFLYQPKPKVRDILTLSSAPAVEVAAE